ncbi:nuclease [Methanosarcinales archaeon]|nr:MAG: nuclease [Methanosarcinales archaeon]
MAYVLNLGDLGKEFDCKADAIRDYVRVRSDVGGEYVRAVGRLAGESSTVNQRLPRYSGSRILEGGFIKPFSHNLKTRGEAHAWLDCVMDGVVVGAVDGSQIYPDKGYDVPIGVVQTAGIYNRHTGAGDFGERTRVELITPVQFERARVYAYSSEFVDAHRFRAECEEIKQLLCEHDEIFVLLDGSLILSHISALNRNIREVYLGAIKDLFQTSEKTENPVIAYTDATRPGDITKMLYHLYALKKTRLQDIPLIQTYLSNWGDRTSAFLCDRDDRRATGDGFGNKSILDRYGEFRDAIAFFYINLGSGIGRAEYPVWAHEKGMTETIADILRAESIIRGGYPDLLIHAHRRALIRTQEHRLFYAMLENFCHANDLPFSKSRKQVHKQMPVWMNYHTRF